MKPTRCVIIVSFLADLGEHNHGPVRGLPRAHASRRGFPSPLSDHFLPLEGHVSRPTLCRERRWFVLNVDDDVESERNVGLSSKCLMFIIQNQNIDATRSLFEREREGGFY